MPLRSAILMLVLLVLVGLQFPGQVAVGDEWRPIDPADLKMTSEPRAPGAPAIYLYRQVDRLDKGRGNTEYNYVRIKILTEEGRRYANIEIPYSGQQGSISGLRARTIHPDGSIVNFDGKTFDKPILKAKGLKYLAKTFTMPDVQVGSIIEYHFNFDFDDGYVFNSTWILSEDLFTRKASFSLKPYERWAVRWTWPIGLPESTEPPKQGSDSIIRMTTQNVPAFQVEDYMPPANELKFRVYFVYSQSTFEQNPEKFWTNFGKNKYGQIEPFINKGKAMTEAVGQIVSPGDSAETKLRKIYARCQQIRNLSYETQKSGEEAKREFKKNQNVEDIWNNGYASGWDIDWLFLGLLRAAGIEAHPVVVASRSTNFFRPETMDSSELNSNLVLVVIDGKERYFDPGNAFAPFGLLPWPESGVSGRTLDGSGGRWIKTDMQPSSESQLQRVAKLKLTEEGTLEGKVTVTYTGLEALSKRLEERHEDDEARKKFMEELVKETIPVTAEVELTNQPEWKGSELPLVAEYNVKIEGWATTAGRRLLFPVGLFSVSEKHLFEHSNRIHPVYFAYFHVKKDDVTIEVPANWKIASLPPPRAQDAKAAEYILKMENKNNNLQIFRSLRIDILLVPKEQYPVLQTFFEVVKTGDDQQVVLEPGTATASSRDD